MSQYGIFTEMIDNHYVGLAQIWVQDSRQYRLVVWHELLLLFLLLIFFAVNVLLVPCTERRILFLDNLHQGNYVDIIELGRGQVDESLCV